jgi:hypothetical protein
VDDLKALDDPIIVITSDPIRVIKKLAAHLEYQQ